ncbi:MAG: hypothetical protein MUE98_16175, partial [Rhodobacteraceae bacterium]|nr:hypothetical protein [Paracoccaceae bacterium]
MANPAVRRESVGDGGGELVEGHAVEPSFDEGPELGVGVELGDHAGTVLAAVLGGRRQLGGEVFNARLK